MMSQALLMRMMARRVDLAGGAVSHLIGILGLVQLLVQLFGRVIELLQTFALYASIIVRQAMCHTPVCCVGRVRLSDRRPARHMHPAARRTLRAPAHTDARPPSVQYG